LRFPVPGAQHGTLRYRSLPLGERITVGMLLAAFVAAAIVVLAMSL
jgi:hypothetical protein